MRRNEFKLDLAAAMNRPCTENLTKSTIMAKPLLAELIFVSRVSYHANRQCPHQMSFKLAFGRFALRKIDDFFGS